MTGGWPDPVADGVLARLGSGWAGAEAAVVLGSGLGGAGRGLPVVRSMAFEDLPGFGPCDVPGHEGRLVAARWAGVDTRVFLGRRHVYEGLTPREAALPARVAAALGARVLVLVSAVGGVDPALGVGRWVYVDDHLNFMGRNPLEGVATAAGPAFVDLTHTYRTDLYSPVARRLGARGVDLARGVLAAFPGPTYETPAEVRWARGAGASVVGMSTVPEAVWARFLGLDVIALGRVVNPAAGVGKSPLDHREVIAEAESAAAETARVVEAVLGIWKDTEQERPWPRTSRSS